MRRLVQRPLLGALVPLLLSGCPAKDGDAAAGGSEGATSGAATKPASIDPAPASGPSEQAADVPDPGEGELGATAGADTEEAPEAEGGESTGGEEVEAVDPRPVAPEGYGILTPPDPAPPEAELLYHVQAGYEVVAVYSKPDPESPRLGFMRIGQRMRAGARVGREGCAKGWYPLEGGGYACASKGLVVEKGKKPFMKHEPPLPKHEEPFPYEWAYVRSWNAPMWWRVPSDSEYKRAKAKREDLEKAREAADAAAKGETPAAEAPANKPSDKPADTKAEEKTAAKPADGEAKADDPKGEAAEGAEPSAPEKDAVAALPAPEGEAKPADAAAKPPEAEAKPPEAAKPSEGETKAAEGAAKPAEGAQPSEGEGDAAAPASEPEEPPPALPLNPGHPWLEKGFFLSLADRFKEGSHTWWRTARGAYVEANAVAKYEPKNFQGVELGEEHQYPVGWVIKKTARVYELGEDDKLKSVGELERRELLDIDSEIDVKGKAYVVLKDGRLVQRDRVVVPELSDPPEGVEPWERWIDVDLRTQSLVAYEGNYPVYVTLVSTGREGTEEEPFTTPEGSWRIYSKMVTSNMDGATATDGNYAIQDVPWVMYFEGSYALHGAFWHRSFGFVRSHGCVNLGPSDARWLFWWTTPQLPQGWHGVNGSDDAPGSLVRVRRSEEPS